MTLVDFYVLQSDNVDAQHTFACRLIDKAVKQGNRVLVATQDLAHSQQIDEHLWAFRPESFIPHRLAGDAVGEQAPVVISHDEDDPEHHDVLVNLRTTIPEQFSRFKRLAEIVVQYPPILKASRKSYAFYKHRGYPINTHKLNC